LPAVLPRLRVKRASLALVFCGIVFFAAAPGLAQTATVDLAQRFSATVTACDATISGADIDNAARAAGLTLTAPTRAADSIVGADPATGVAAFFGPDTQIRSAKIEVLGGFVVFVTASDGSKCEVLGVGQADLSGGAAAGLAAGARNWQPVVGTTQEMRRANGDRVAVQQTMNAQGVQIVLLHFIRGEAGAAQSGPVGIAEQFRRSVAACDAIISGADINGVASATGLTLSAPTRAADTGMGADSEVSRFFGADTPVRVAVAQDARGIMFFFVSVGGDKCEATGAGRADFPGALSEILAAETGWSSNGDARQVQRANGDVIRIQQIGNAESGGGFAYFTRGTNGARGASRE
jgi:hypothetical protein